MKSLVLKSVGSFSSNLTRVKLIGGSSGVRELVHLCSVLISGSVCLPLHQESSGRRAGMPRGVAFMCIKCFT